MRHECIGLALVLARQGMVREAAAQLLRDGLDEVDDHFFGLPLPELQRKGESDKEVDAKSATDAHVSERFFGAPCIVLGLCFGSECLLLSEHFGVVQELVRRGAEHVQLVAVFGLPQLVVGLGGDVLGGVPLVVGEVGAGNVLGVEEVRGAETILWGKGFCVGQELEFSKLCS